MGLLMMLKTVIGKTSGVIKKATQTSKVVLDKIKNRVKNAGGKSAKETEKSLASADKTVQSNHERVKKVTESRIGKLSKSLYNLSFLGNKKAREKQERKNQELYFKYQKKVETEGLKAIKSLSRPYKDRVTSVMKFLTGPIIKAYTNNFQTSTLKGLYDKLFEGKKDEYESDWEIPEGTRQGKGNKGGMEGQGGDDDTRKGNEAIDKSLEKEFEFLSRLMRPEFLQDKGKVKDLIAFKQLLSAAVTSQFMALCKVLKNKFDAEGFRLDSRLSDLNDNFINSNMDLAEYVRHIYEDIVARIDFSNENVIVPAFNRIVGVVDDQHDIIVEAVEETTKDVINRLNDMSEQANEAILALPPPKEDISPVDTANEIVLAHGKQLEEVTETIKDMFLLQADNNRLAIEAQNTEIKGLSLQTKELALKVNEESDIADQEREDRSKQEDPAEVMKESIGDLAHDAGFMIGSISTALGMIIKKLFPGAMKAIYAVGGFLKKHLPAVVRVLGMIAGLVAGLRIRDLVANAGSAIAGALSGLPFGIGAIAGGVVAAATPVASVIAGIGTTTAVGAIGMKLANAMSNPKEPPIDKPSMKEKKDAGTSFSLDDLTDEMVEGAIPEEPEVDTSDVDAILKEGESTADDSNTNIKELNDLTALGDSEGKKGKKKSDKKQKEEDKALEEAVEEATGEGEETQEEENNILYYDETTGKRIIQNPDGSKTFIGFTPEDMQKYQDEEWERLKREAGFVEPEPEPEEVKEKTLSERQLKKIEKKTTKKINKDVQKALDEYDKAQEAKAETLSVEPIIEEEPIVEEEPTGTGEEVETETIEAQPLHFSGYDWYYNSLTAGWENLHKGDTHDEITQLDRARVHHDKGMLMSEEQEKLYEEWYYSDEGPASEKEKKKYRKQKEKENQPVTGEGEEVAETETEAVGTGETISEPTSQPLEKQKLVDLITGEEITKRSDLLNPHVFIDPNSGSIKFTGGMGEIDVAKLAINDPQAMARLNDAGWTVEGTRLAPYVTEPVEPTPEPIDNVESEGTNSNGQPAVLTITQPTETVILPPTERPATFGEM